MRPIFLQQAIFAGFMCCTSIFYFIDSLGYKYLTQVSNIDIVEIDQNLQLVAQCQRLSVLAHAALVTGILLGQLKGEQKVNAYKPTHTLTINSWTVRICIMSFILSFIFEKIPGLFQFSIGLYNVTIFCGATILVSGLRNKNSKVLFFGGLILILNIAKASLSGYKEPVVINFIILFCLLFPYYRRESTILGIPFFIFFFYVAPTYSSVVRKEAWFGESTAEDARQEAIEHLLNDETELDETNWTFLTGRLSEIGMFTQFVRSTPEIIPYYHTEIIENSLINIIPRALWTNKPITEEIAMERVYAAGVVDDRSKVSAKARPVVDGYLSGGFIGVFLYMLFLGLISQSICNKAESFFGGYQTGCVIFFNGFFQILWRGESTEFMVNSIFWSFLAMLLFWLGLRITNYIEKANPLDYTKI